LTERNHYWKADIDVLRCSCMVVINMEFYSSWFATSQAPDLLHNNTCDFWGSCDQKVS